MILLLLKDGAHVEIPDCSDVIHKYDCLVCLNSGGAPIMSVSTEDVHAYTLEPKIAREFVELPDMQATEPRHEPRLRRFRRHRHTSDF